MSGPLRILGIDPGTLRVGFGLISQTGNRLRCEGFGVIEAGRSGTSLAERLGVIFDGLGVVLAQEEPALVVVEDAFVHKNPRSAIRIGEGRGVCILAARQAGIPVCEYSPAEVKKAVTGNGRASKEQVREMVRRLLRMGAIEAQHDASDALALAICHTHRRRFQAALRQGSRREAGQTPGGLRG